MSFPPKSAGHMLIIHMMKMWCSWGYTLSSLILENITEIKVSKPTPGYQVQTACVCQVSILEYLLNYFMVYNQNGLL